MRPPLAARIATHASRTLVFRFHLALRVHLPAPAEGVAGGPRDRIPAGAIRPADPPLGTEGTRRDREQAALHLPLAALVRAASRDSVPLPGRTSFQSAASPAAGDRVRLE